MKTRLGPYLKALILLVLIVLAAIGDALGLSLGLDPEHYAGLLAADFLVWLTPAPGYHRDAKTDALP